MMDELDGEKMREEKRSAGEVRSLMTRLVWSLSRVSATT